MNTIKCHVIPSNTLRYHQNRVCYLWCYIHLRWGFLNIFLSIFKWFIFLFSPSGHLYINIIAMKNQSTKKKHILSAFLSPRLCLLGCGSWKLKNIETGGRKIVLGRVSKTRGGGGGGTPITDGFRKTVWHPPFVRWCTCFQKTHTGSAGLEKGQIWYKKDHTTQPTPRKNVNRNFLRKFHLICLFLFCTFAYRKYFIQLMGNTFRLFRAPSVLQDIACVSLFGQLSTVNQKDPFSLHTTLNTLLW